MALCEMCGKDTNLITANIDGAELNVCNSCGKYGTIKKKSAPVRQRYKKQEGPVLRVVSNFSNVIRSAREQQHMSQEEFAKSIQEKESVVQKWESGTLKPRIGIAKQLERILKITLLEKDEVKQVEMKRAASDEFTLGDFIKVRKRK